MTCYPTTGSVMVRRDMHSEFCECLLLSYSYNKSQQDALFLKFIFDIELYMFWTDLLSIIRRLNTVHAAIGICHASYVDCLLARSGWNAVPS